MRPSDFFTGPEYLEVGGTMDCDTCHEKVHEGRYFLDSKILAFQCSKGHKTVIEDFKV